jgi:hypothetical protein
MLASADLREAKLAGARLEGASFECADLRGADLAGATWNQDTTWPAGFDPGAAGALYLPPPREPRLSGRRNQLP